MPQFLCIMFTCRVSTSRLTLSLAAHKQAGPMQRTQFTACTKPCRNIGGLPVPVLIVANKTDRLRSSNGQPGTSEGVLDALTKLIGGANHGNSNSSSSSAGGGASAASSSGGSHRMAQIGSAFLEGCRWRRRGSGSGGGMGLCMSSSGPSLPDLEGHIRSVSASATTGSLEWGTVGAFFTALWARRYQPNTRSSARFFLQLPSPGPRPAPLYSPTPSGMDRRLDDEDEDKEDRRLDDWT